MQVACWGYNQITRDEFPNQSLGQPDEQFDCKIDFNPLRDLSAKAQKLLNENKRPENGCNSMACAKVK